jgi:hypothetical protein
MPIKGWSDAVRVPRLGQIALGYKDEKGVPYGVDYFVVPPEVQEVYGREPRELDVLIPGEDLDKVFPAWLKRYGDQFGLICRGDGETATLSAVYARKFGADYGVVARHLAAAAGGEGIGGWQYVFAATGEIVPVEVGGDGAEWLRTPCGYKECPHYRAKKCTEVAMLNVLLPRVPGVLGVYQLDTGSFFSYQNVVNALEILRRMVGRISFVPLKLKVRMETHHPLVVHGGQEKRVKSQNPVLYVDMGDLTLEKVLKLAREGRLLQVAALPAAGPLEIEPPDEAKPELLYPPQEERVEAAEPEADLSAVLDAGEKAKPAQTPSAAPEPAPRQAVAPEVTPPPAPAAAPQEPEPAPPAASAADSSEKPAAAAPPLPQEDLVFRATGRGRPFKDKRGQSCKVPARLVSGDLAPGDYVVYSVADRPVAAFLEKLERDDEFVVPAGAVRQVRGSAVVIREAGLRPAAGEPEDWDLAGLADLGEDLDADEAF